jgi:hypothetical protein
MKTGDYVYYYGYRYVERRGHLVFIIKGYRYEKRYFDVEFADGLTCTVNYEFLKPI